MALSGNKLGGGNTYGRLCQRRQNKVGKVWEQTKATTRLVVSYFNWIWQHSHCKTTAAQRAGLAAQLWTWYDIAPHPTII